jgi:hypothetical protein
VRRALVAVVGVAALAGTADAPAATPATVSTADPCYSSRELVDFAGSGFRAGREFAVTVAGKRVASGRVTRFGDLAGTFHAPVPASAGPGERAFTLSVSDGARQATTRFRSTIFGAGFRPSEGDPATLRVRFFAYDFGVAQTIYLHYLAPDLRLRRTVSLGPTRGPCGSLVSARRRIFPFRTHPGRWRLQFDTSQRYRRRARPRVRLIVPILRAG